MTTKFKHERSQSVLTQEVQVAYPFVHEKRTKNWDGTAVERPQHEVTLLFPKTNLDAAKCTNYQMLMGLCMEAVAKSWPSGWPQGGSWPIQDGDAVKAPTAPGEQPKEYPWKKGHWVVQASCNLDTGVAVGIKQPNGEYVDLPARTINGMTYYKSGDYAQVRISAFTYHNKKFGVKFGFDAICWKKPGDAIGNSGPKSASQIFGGVASAGPPMGTAPIVAPGGPPMPPGPQQGPVGVPTAPNYPALGGPPIPPPTPTVVPGGPPMPPGYALPAFPRGDNSPPF